VALDKEFLHLPILGKGQDWKRLTMLTPDLATGGQQGVVA